MKYAAALLLVLLVRASVWADSDSLRPKNLVFEGGGVWGIAYADARMPNVSIRTAIYISTEGFRLRVQRMPVKKRNGYTRVANGRPSTFGPNHYRY